MKNKILLSVIMFTIPVIFACNPMHGRKANMELNKGRAFETAQFNQRINAEPEINVDPVEGFDGNAANYAIDKYQGDFKKEQTTTEVFNISRSKN